MASALELLTALTSLRLDHVFVPAPHHLASLCHLDSLATLSLGFGTEWWMHAGAHTATVLID